MKAMPTSFPSSSELEIVLCDVQPELVRAWRHAFAAYPRVEVRLGDLTEIDADAYVSPANSFGVMDGGIDAALSERFPGIEARVKEALVPFGRRLPVGYAILVETEDDLVPFLVCAPTMEIPSYVGHTRNAFEAMFALLLAVQRYNAENAGVIAILAIPGLCTGVGGMECQVAAEQMAQAYADWLALG